MNNSSDHDGYDALAAFEGEADAGAKSLTSSFLIMFCPVGALTHMTGTTRLGLATLLITLVPTRAAVSQK
jgi:hypothetical protein